MRRPGAARRGGGIFTDVPAGAWYESAVEEAVEQGWMTGVSDTLFSPNATVTRSTVAMVLWRMEGGAHPGVARPFPLMYRSTAGTASPPTGPVRPAIINGTDQGTFSDGVVTPAGAGGDAQPL